MMDNRQMDKIYGGMTDVDITSGEVFFLAYSIKPFGG